MRHPWLIRQWMGYKRLPTISYFILKIKASAVNFHEHFRYQIYGHASLNLRINIFRITLALYKCKRAQFLCCLITYTSFLYSLVFFFSFYLNSFPLLFRHVRISLLATGFNSEKLFLSKSSILEIFPQIWRKKKDFFF